MPSSRWVFLVLVIAWTAWMVGRGGQGEAPSTVHMVAADDQTFDARVLASDLPVVVDFGATWCPPCKLLTPVLDEIAGEYSGKVNVVSVDVDDAPMTARAYGIRMIPAVVFVDQGEVKGQLTGLHAKAEYVERIEALLGGDTCEIGDD